MTITSRDDEIFRTYVECTFELVQSITHDFGLEYANPAWLKVLHFSETDIGNISLKDYVFPGYIQRTKQNLSKALNGQRLQGLFITLQTKGGAPIQVEMNLFPRYKDNHVASVIAIYRILDDSDNKVNTLLHEQCRSEAIIDLMTYDLAAINKKIHTAFETALAAPNTPVSLRAILQEGLSEVNHSIAFISNIEKLWLIARKPPKLLKCDLGETLFSAKEIIGDAFPHKRVSITSKLEPGQYYVTADEFLIEIFKSILHHIVMMDTRTTVQIEVDVESLSQTPFLKLQIKDHGRGLSESEKSDVLDDLTQRNADSYGLGLELALTRHLLENYGGYIRIEDRIGKKPHNGSNFIILLRQSQGK